MNNEIFKTEYYGKEVNFFLPNERDHIQNVIKTTGTFYEVEMLRDLLKLVPTGTVAVDVGANIGNHTLFFAAICGLKTFSFEPVNSTSEILEKNISINNLNEKVTRLSFALGSEEGIASMEFPNIDNIGMARVVRSEHASDVRNQVQVRTLDSFELKNVGLIKIDVEGMELDVLKGSINTIKENRPIVLAELQKVEEYNSVREFLQAMNYIAVERYNATPTIMFWPEEDINKYMPFFFSKGNI